MPKSARTLTLLGFVGVAVACCATRASAATISLGTRIAISPTTFAVPIDIAGAVNVSSWTFDLTYDATDVQVNTSCDPFSGDIYLFPAVRSRHGRRLLCERRAVQRPESRVRRSRSRHAGADRPSLWRERRLRRLPAVSVW